MNSLIQLKTLGSRGRNPARSLPLRRGFLLIRLILVCFAFAPQMRAASCHQVINGGGNLAPPPHGGYCNFTTAEGTSALFHLNDGLGNTALGWFSLFNNTTASFNTGVGAGTLMGNNADQNTAVGAGALLTNTDGFQNNAIGVAALSHNVTGSFNTAIGANALGSSTGSLNTALGINAGLNLTTGDNNIYIGNLGVDGESNTIRIGGDTGAGSQTATFIAGVSGTAVVGDPVVVDANGQLGTATSSARFKTDIKPMDKTSEAILALKPVSFQYKSDSNGMPQFGLIAEEVAKVNPDLVVRDRKGEIYSVRYEAVNAMLLNEFLKAHRRMKQQEAMIERQQEQIDALTKGLQKVSAQLEASKPAPQVVNNP
jgi:trimeric autotransporter adhesin